MPARGLVGLGLDGQFEERYPGGGLAGLCHGLRERLSHVSIVSLRDEAHARWFKSECAGDLPIVHHLSGVAPASSGGPDVERYALLDGISRALGARWSCEDIAIWSLGPYAIPYFTPPILSEEMAEHVAAGISRLEALGCVPFLAEIPSFTLITGELSLGEFFGRVTQGSGCGLVADVSHVFSYAINMRRSPSSVLRSLPLERVRELHIAGGHVDGASERRYMDTHSEPILPEILELLGEAVTLCPNLCGVTYEIGVGLRAEDIEQGLQQLEQSLSERGWSPRMAEQPGPSSSSRA